MTQNNLLQGYTWDFPYEISTQQNSEQRGDEVISIYEIYVKEETVAGSDGKGESSVVLPAFGNAENRLIQGDCVELDGALDSEMIRIDSSVVKLFNKDATKYKILEQSVDENFTVYSQSTNDVQPNSATRLVDKDDPRSRLHFVKYLKRDGKTLKIWECGICSKEFRHQYTLMRHLPTHTDERNFKCETCGKAFRQLSTLSQHRAIHSDARPYVCEYCKKTFNRVSTLISHRKTHSEDKPHKCHICGKGFHQKGNLRNHVFTHTNERPYKCTLCGKGFNQMSNLVCHKVKSHAHVEKSLQYVCSICGKEFPRRFSLRSHEEYKHGIKYCQPSSRTVLDVSGKVAAKGPKNPDAEHQTDKARHSAKASGAGAGSSSGSVNNNRTTSGVSIDSQNRFVGQDDFAGGIIIDAIRTKAMEEAMSLAQTPFALLKPVKGIPILVKVSPAAGMGNGKQILNPATAEDLGSAGKMSFSPSTMTTEVDGVKAFQMKVPVVATVTQTLDAFGNSNFVIEPPAPDQEQENLIETRLSCLDTDYRNRLRVSDAMNEELVSKDCDLSTALQASDADIRYVRATEDGRYEMMTNSEARDLMAQNCHDVTVLNDLDVASISFGDQMTINERMNAREQRNVPNVDGIEILGDKDFRILGGRCLRDEKYSVDDISILEQSKIDDFILGSRGMSSDPIVNDGFSPVLDSPFRNVNPNDLVIFNRRQPGLPFFHQNSSGYEDKQSQNEAAATVSRKPEVSIFEDSCTEIAGPVSGLVPIDRMNDESKALGASKCDKIKIKILG